MAGDVPVSGLGNVGVQLHAEAGGRVSETVLDDPRVLACIDQEAGGDVAEPVEGEVLGKPGARDRGVEHPRRRTGATCRRLSVASGSKSTSPTASMWERRRTSDTWGSSGETQSYHHPR